MARVFFYLILSWWLLWAIPSVCLPQGHPQDLLSFFILFIYSTFLFFLFLYFTPKLFCFFCIQFLISLGALFTNKLVEFSSVILKGPVLFVLLDPAPVPFESPISFGLSHPVVLILSAVVSLGSFLSVWFLYVLSSFIVLLALAVSLFVLLSSFPIKVLYFFLDYFGDTNSITDSFCFYID